MNGTSITATTVQANGMAMRVARQGQGPALLFAHCLGGDLAAWAPQLAAYSANYTTIAYDLRGQGGSQVTPGPYTMELLADDAIALLDALGIERAVFVGVSMGGMVAMAAALQAPQRFAGLVIADSAGGFTAEARQAWDERIAAVRAGGLAPMVETMMGRWFTDAFRRRAAAQVAAVGDLLRRAPVDGYVASCAAVRDLDLLPRLPQLKVPALVICGEKDPSTPLALSEAIAAALPDARLAVIPGAHHLTQLEFPETFNGLIDGFLAEIDYA
jgi:3-oxoadipate enol-lactonase